MLALVLVGCEKNNNSSQSKSTSPIISLSKGDPFSNYGVWHNLLLDSLGNYPDTGFYSSTHDAYQVYQDTMGQLSVDYQEIVPHLNNFDSIIDNNPPSKRLLEYTEYLVSSGNVTPRVQVGLDSLNRLLYNFSFDAGQGTSENLINLRDTLENFYAYLYGETSGYTSMERKILLGAVNTGIYSLNYWRNVYVTPDHYYHDELIEFINEGNIKGKWLKDLLGVVTTVAADIGGFALGFAAGNAIAPGAGSALGPVAGAGGSKAVISAWW
ncbi:MAG: hypothetical protein RI842_10620 [Schleiferiaceae bacterium]|nr:hypothetical protein [Schleiferiaceae bacterium]